MIIPPLPKNEQERLQDLVETELLDTPKESEFDDIVKLASQICNMPISLITLVDSNRQWFKAKVGLDADETSREVSFCGHAIMQDQLFEVQDALNDDRFFDNPLVIEDPSIRFYAGYPLITNTGNRLGTLCVIDRVPRKLTDEQIFALKVLSENVIKIAELRQKNKHLNHMAETHKKMTSILAHDVRSPMVSIKGIIDYKKAGLFGEDEAEEMMDIALEQLSNTLQMVDDVVDWGQSQLKYYDVQKEIVNLRDIVGSIFGYEALKARIKNNELLNHVDDIQLITDKNAITFIIRNLVSNANKFTENGEIRISSIKRPNHIDIYIEDTGAGMAEEISSKLFTNATVSTTGTKNEKGNGLGLLLVNEYINKLNGSISVESAIGTGSRFTIKLTEIEL
ncbi:MAG: GAF domain-containing sensor histidine kinase [Bacteroidetes bacterium]|jgi:signal transduction histidine kinase|nr:GAF domain-containing sensor histidine kinase [Bacteroidota bacterium]